MFDFKTESDATVSFERNLVISDEEEAQRMLDAIAEADERGPVQYSDFSEQLAIGREFLKRGLKATRATGS